MNFLKKKIVVFGMGRSGLAALNLLVKAGAKDFWAVNKGNPLQWNDIERVRELIDLDRCIDELAAEDLFLSADLIILSPGIALNHFALKKAVLKGVTIWSEIELAFRFCQCPIIALTGTNGKTTTVSLMGDILQRAGRKVFVGGNIGIPFCEYALAPDDYDIVVLELSSFQLETIIDFHPSVAIILNIFPNHGERYDNISQYAAAKFNITKNMTSKDDLFYPHDNSLIGLWSQKQKCQLRAVDASSAKMELAKNFDLSNFKLEGKHNLSNLYFAFLALKRFNVDNRAIQESINEFTGVAHRLQFLASIDSFRAFNDAKSTNWDATKVAVDSIDKRGGELFVILGGQKRGNNDSIVPHLSFFKERVDRFLLIGETSEMLAHELNGHIDYLQLGTLEAAVAFVRQQDFKGTLLLSPAFPSYDQYQNYVKRGEHFISLIGNKK